MQYLQVGTTVFAVAHDVADEWPAIEAEASREAASYGVHGVVYVRTDSSGTGTMSVLADHPVTFTTEGEPTSPDLGMIIAASADLGELQARYPVSPDPEASDEEIAEIVRELKEERPDADWDNLLMGRLAGPISSARPDVPVWDYLSFAEAHPDIRLSVLTAARFPVRYFEGPGSVTSVDEELKPPAANSRAQRPTLRWTETAETVIGRYAALYDAGVVRWDPEQRGITYLQPIGSYRSVLLTYAAHLAGQE